MVAASVYAPYEFFFYFYCFLLWNIYEKLLGKFLMVDYFVNWGFKFLQVF